MQSLFLTLAGADFAHLPHLIRLVHSGAPTATFNGACDIERGNGWLARLAGWIAGMPPAATQIALRVRIDADAAGEVWTRYFGTRQMRSRLFSQDGLLIEQLGPLSVAFELVVRAQSLRWIPRRGRVLGIALPARFFSRITAIERVDDGRYTFDVRASLPIAGAVIHYRGWLDVK